MTTRAITLLLAATLALAGCSLPFREGTGDGSYEITVRMHNLGNLVRNAEVKVGDITVGTVTGIEFDDWTAKLTVGLKDSVTLPANAEARVAQKSLLGAQYLELASPRDGKPVGRLRDGDAIPLNRTGHYPETEELLSALSMLLNHGGLTQVETITSELNAALSGNEAETRSLLRNVGKLATTLNSRKGDIVASLENVKRLSHTLAEQRAEIDRALRTVPPGLAALERQRSTLVNALSSISRFGDVASRVIEASRDDLKANLESLQPVLGELANAGKDLTGALGFMLTFPFPSNQSFPAVVNGDYANLYITVDLDPETLSRNMLRGLTIAGVPILGGSSLAEGIVNSNPLTAGIAEHLPLPLGQEAERAPGAPQPEAGDGEGGRGGLLGSILGEPAGGGNP